MASSYDSDIFDGVEENKNDNRLVPESCGERLISTLRKERFWGADQYQYQGFWYHRVYLLGTIQAQQSFRARDTDILLASCPKSGTTWMKALMFAITNRKDYAPCSSSHPLLEKNPHNCVPLLEVTGNDPVADLDSLPSPRLLSTHIPYASLPKSILNKNWGGRIVYIARDPKDVFVSSWMFFPKILRSSSVDDVLFKNDHLQTSPNVNAMEEAFQLFCRGVSTRGPIWDHVLEYWKMSLKRPNEVLFLKYEDMKMDTIYHVKRLAEFIGHPFSLVEETQGVVQDIINLCSFQNLSNLEVNKTGKLHVHEGGSQLTVDNNNFFRRGEVGDSKNHLTREMRACLDNLTEEKLGTFGLKL